MPALAMVGQSRRISAVRRAGRATPRVAAGAEAASGLRRAHCWAAERLMNSAMRWRAGLAGLVQSKCSATMGAKVQLRSGGWRRRTSRAQAVLAGWKVDGDLGQSPSHRHYGQQCPCSAAQHLGGELQRHDPRQQYAERQRQTSKAESASAPAALLALDLNQESTPRIRW